MYPYEEKWDGKSKHREFDSLGEFIAFSRLPTDLPEYSRYSVTKSANTSWDLGAGLEGAYKLAEQGWPEGADRVARITERILGKINMAIGNQVAAVPSLDGGAWVDVSRYCAGEPEHFWRFEESERSKRIVEIGVSLSASAVIESSTICNRGAALLAAICAMEQRGFSVGITIYTGGREVVDCGCDTLIKTPGQVLDVDRLAFCLIHPALLRRIWFAAQERECAHIRLAVGSSYGAPSDSANRGRFDYYLPCMSGRQPDFETEERAIAWTLRFIEKYGITAGQ